MDQERKPREGLFIRGLVPDWRPTREQVLWAVRIAIVLVGLLGILTLVGLPFGITLWAWVKLLIVPAVIAAGGIWFNRQQRERELEVENQRAQDEALQAYLDQMSQLLLDEGRPLRQSKEGDEVRSLARARTLTVLPRLDGERKRSVLQFIYESGLVNKIHPVLDLTEADLIGAALSWARLKGVCLRRGALRGANLKNAQLEGADLEGAWLEKADLREAKLSEAKLNEANLRDANLHLADLFWAKLREANLHMAVLTKADLRKVDLTHADLSKANLSEANLYQACVAGVNLTGATMPDGQILKSNDNPNGPTFEDWLKSNDRAEDETSKSSS